MLFISLLTLTFTPSAHAWGRHDLITKLMADSPDFARLVDARVTAESIDKAAPDLLRRAFPRIRSWSELYHRAHDPRYPWKAPASDAFQRQLTAREELLWSFENNIRSPLDFSVTASDREDAPRRATFGASGMPTSGPALEILERFVEEPDAQIDGGLNVEPYYSRLSKSMSLFDEGNAHTHTFRHYYVPHSIIPPLATPRGVAPARAALFAKVAIEAFRTGHRYWGYRFLAWSLHYAQDVTQPWHTVFLPGFSFLSFSKQSMRREVAAIHYLTEALADSWLARVSFGQVESPFTNRAALGAEANAIWRHRRENPWAVAELVELAARRAHAQIGDVADDGRALFSRIVENLDFQLVPKTTAVNFGGVSFPFALLDFTGNGTGATAFLSPLWDPRFPLAAKRDRLIDGLSRALSTAVEVSRLITEFVLEEGGETRPELSRRR